MMEAVLPTYTETFTVKEEESGVIVDSGTLHGEGWTFCMVDYDHLIDDDNNSDLSNDGSDDIIMLDVEGDFFNKDNSDVEESDRREVKSEEDDNSHVDGYVDIKEINMISRVTEADYSHAHVGGEINIENNVEIDKTFEQNDLEIEMSCDSYVSHNMNESNDTYVDELNYSRTDHLEMNIKSEASLDLEDTVSNENYNQYGINCSREMYTNETNNLHFMKSDYQDDNFTQFSATNNYVDTGSSFSDVEVNNIPVYSNNGDGDIPDVFDVGLLPYLMQQKKEEENIQSILDHREKIVKQKSRNKMSSTGGCCVGCDTMMKGTAHSKRYKQDQRIKQKVMNQMEMLKRRSDELNITTEILDQYCLECSKQIDKIDHYRSFLQCSVCGYRTHCSKAYPDHMITKHGRLANPENTNREFSTGFMECICGVVHIDGNKMANHLVACEYGGMYCRASNLGSVLKRSRDDIDILTAETPQRKIPYSQKQTTTNRISKNSKRTSQCSELKSRQQGRIFSNTEQVINRNSTNCSWVLEKPNDIREVHNYSMPYWLERFKKNANLKKIYNNFRKCATSTGKSWTGMINTLNEQHQTVNIAQQFSCELEFKKIKVINAEVPIQDYLQEETGPHEIQNIEQEDTKIENSASMVTAPNQKHDKNAHNCRERRRRNDMSRLYFELNLLVPQFELNSKRFIQGKKYCTQSKQNILTQSIIYINMLEKAAENLKEEKDRILLQQDVLKASLKDMQDRL